MDDDPGSLFDDHFGDNGDGDSDSEARFECAAYLVGGRRYCPIAGTEECDWECPGP